MNKNNIKIGVVGVGTVGSGVINLLEKNKEEIHKALIDHRYNLHIGC